LPDRKGDRGRGVGARSALGEYLEKWIPLSIIVGSMAGLGALIFQFTLDWVWSLSYESISLPWYIIVLVPAIGGLLAGLIITRFAPETAGPGTDQIIDAVHHHGGRVRGRVVPVKIVASALTIGSGGSSGNEGPISQISGGIASYIGARLGLSRSEMRILVISGMAAGWSAVFRAPLGSAIFAIEVPYKNDIESSATVPSIIASVVSYLVFVPFGGAEPIFTSNIPPFSLSPQVLLPVLLLGVLIGFLGIVFVKLIRAVRGTFKKTGMPLVAATAAGGLTVGVIGLFSPEVLGLGEGAIQTMLDGTFVSLAFLLGILVAKAVATAMTVGSGGSGGIFFPSLMIGGALGGSLALFLDLQPYSLYVLVGMGAMMAGISKTPIAASVLVTEMVGGFTVLIPLMIASTLAYLVSGRHSLYDAQITSGRFGLDFTTLGDVKIKDIMTTKVVTVNADMSIAEVRKMAGRSPHNIYPVIRSGEVLGVVTGRELANNGTSAAPVWTIMNSDYHWLPSESPASDAFEIMTSEKISTIVIKGPGDSGISGILSRIDLLDTMEHLDERHHYF
jgi:CIC family chloride channel protein